MDGQEDHMVKKRASRSRAARTGPSGPDRTSSTVDEMLLAALERGDDSFQTGRLLATFKEGAGDAGLQSFASAQGMRVADACDFDTQAVVLEDVAGAEPMRSRFPRSVWLSSAAMLRARGG